MSSVNARKSSNLSGYSERGSCSLKHEKFERGKKYGIPISLSFGIRRIMSNFEDEQIFNFPLRSPFKILVCRPFAKHSARSSVIKNQGNRTRLPSMFIILSISNLKLNVFSFWSGRESEPGYEPCPVTPKKLTESYASIRLLDQVLPCRYSVSLQKSVTTLLICAGTFQRHLLCPLNRQWRSVIPKTRV